MEHQTITPSALSPAQPACEHCNSPSRFVRAPHRHGDGWQIRCVCTRCRRDAVPSHVWWQKSLFSSDVLAALPELEARQRAANEQLDLLGRR
jgi:hypothetical protein